MKPIIKRNGFYCNISQDLPTTFTQRMDNLMSELIFQSCLTLKDIRGSKRDANLVAWRQIGMYIAVMNNYGTLVKIAHYFNRHWATVIHARTKITEGLEINDPFIVNKIKAMGKYIHVPNSNSKSYNYIRGSY
jgi:chromosomal replication initiation ATPase DnaA